MAAIDNTSGNQLDAYRAKRSAAETPEPFSGSASTTGRLFVVQKHAATRLHYDLRLEVGGVLKSWAVPRGPSMDHADKRLAVFVEDHPIDYADFEGIIPDDNYGAGAVIVWDQGTWTPKIDFEEGFEKGKLLFRLDGFKLHGLWTLVKIKKSDNEWLLIKERDAWTLEEGADPPHSERSIFSGLLVEELKAGRDLRGPLRDDLAAGDAVESDLDPRDVELMLATVREGPFTDPKWIYELKYDGYRLLAAREGTQPLLQSRRGHDITATFPEVAKAIKALPYQGFILDGEVAVHDEAGLPSFQRLQKRGRLSKRLEIQRAAAEFPAIMYVFDLLAIEGYDLRPLPLTVRKEFLRRVLPSEGALRYSDHVEERGELFFAQVEKMQLEGMVAKRADSPYLGGRSPDWLKIRLDRSDDFVVVGFSEPKGSRTGVGALHVAAYDAGELVYAGRVGSGFSEKELGDLRQQLDGMLRETAPCVGPELPRTERHHWVEPELICEVRYKEWPDGALLRQPVFLRFRDDKPVEDCVRPGGEPAFVAVGEVVDDSRPQVPFSNLDKIFWQEEGYTKGDLIEYYRAISPWLLPYLRDRPVVLTRFPDGIDGKSFFQKDAPEWTPDWVRREKMWSEDSGKETHFFVADDVESLLYIINLGSIPLHIWSSPVAALERPDWTILDLDPKEAPFSHVVQTALVIHELCEEIGLPCFAKTSGSSGIHVLVPLGGQCTYAQSKAYAELLARVTASRQPDIATTERGLQHRKGRVYIDFVQNGHGKLLVSPFCARPLPGAPVSMPLRWSDVNDDLQILNYTIENAPSHMRALENDPMAPVLATKPDLGAALTRLGELMSE